MRHSAFAAAMKAAPLRLWALILGGPPLTALAAAYGWVIWKGPWPVELAGEQLRILGYAQFIALALVGVVVIALASVKVKGAALGGSFEVEADDPPAATATATLEVHS